MKKIFVSFLIAVLAFGAPVSSFAGYAQLKPPPGWSQGMGAAVPGQAGVFKFGAAANGSSFKGGTVLTNAQLAVGGQMVTVPVSMRLASNAASFAASFAFRNPYLIVASLAYQWFKDSGLSVKDGIWGKDIAGDGVLLWRVVSMPDYVFSKTSACSAFAARTYCGSGTVTGTVVNDSCQVSVSNVNGTFNCSGGAFESKMGPGDPLFVPIGDPEFHTIMDPKPVPLGVPQALPGVDLPVEKPVFNPSPSVDPLPAPSAPQEPRPLWIPTGDPAKNPNPDRNPDGSPKPLPDGSVNPNPRPDTWTQPGARVNPSPTVSDPWRVDIQPEDKTKNDPSPNADQPIVTTTPTPQKIEIETCGLPGKPKCIIDELDTPQKVTDEVYKPKLDDYKNKQGELKDKVAGSADKSFFSGWSSVFLTPPIQACTGYVLPRDMGTLDPCPVVDGVRSIMAYIWALTAMWLAMGMIKKVI